ncbi:MAG: hypothetical protein R3C53_11955 [Pirellulaceae bacterium]
MFKDSNDKSTRSVNPEDAHATSVVDRRTLFVSAAGMCAVPLFSKVGQAASPGPNLEAVQSDAKSLIGNYGSWASQLAPNPPELSFRRDKWDDIDVWRDLARAKAAELIASPVLDDPVEVRELGEQRVDDLDITHLSWQLPYGRETQAILLKPAGATGPLPGVLGLHDHGGNKYFGKRKITSTGSDVHPLIQEHQREYYGGRAWANELAKRGYAVLVHDTFTFASRRVLFDDMATIPWGACKTEGKSDEDPEDASNIAAYNAWASEHEHIMAKSLFSAGTTWPGVFLAEDRIALGVLGSRPNVDAARLGCAGLSGGGLRTVYLGGLDPRVRCAVCVGFMSTWNDFVLHKSYTHTWMTYTPLIARYLDFPEILGMRVPLPTMTMSCREDSLYTLPEMEKADRILQDIFAKAGFRDHYSGRFYAGGHKFDQSMHLDAFHWFDRWLKT